MMLAMMMMMEVILFLFFFHCLLENIIEDFLSHKPHIYGHDGHNDK